MEDNKIKTAYYIIGIFLVSALVLLIYNSQINQDLTGVSPAFACRGTNDAGVNQCNPEIGGCREQINKCREKMETRCPEDKCIQGDIMNTCTDFGKNKTFCQAPNLYWIRYTCYLDCISKPSDAGGN